ncbi:MAG TPA: hypothetical protein VNJ70_19245 [Thermoanaerobaculia bacterium]|nr:hypothetical protein [Thermoanaerobaculia bacterium]
MSRVRSGIFALALAFAADAAAGGELELISRTAAGLPPDTAGGRSFLPRYVRPAERSENARSVSADGRYVVFLSQAGNVVPGQPNPPPVALGGDLFVYDRVTRSRRLISRRLISSSLPAEVLSATISADDRFVAFESLAEDLVPGQLPGGSGNVYLYDREAASTTLVSRVPASGVTGGNGMSSEPVLSADGRFMAFSSLATDLISGQIEGNFAADVFLFDRASGTTVLVSRTAASATTTGNGSSRDPAISADGRYIAYESTASDLIAGQAGGGSNVFVFDSVAGTTTLVSHTAGSATDGASGSQDAVISADGSRIAFTSSATDLVPGQIDTNFRPDAFLYDRTAGTTLLVSHASTSATTACDHSARPHALSSDGAYLVLESHATDLVAGQSDTNGFLQTSSSSRPPPASRYC